MLDDIFSVFPTIDFEKKMIVVYIYATANSNYQEKLVNIALDNKNLKITYKCVKGKHGDKNVHMPQRVFLIIKMDKLDIETVEFDEVY